METFKSLRQASIGIHAETMELFKGSPRYELRAYVSMLVQKAFLKGLESGYWKGMNDAKEVLAIQHLKRCREDFNYWREHCCVVDTTKRKELEMEEKIEINLSECKNQELASTIMQMVSPDYKERFIAEYVQLKNRYFALQRMVEDWDKGRLNFVPTCPRSTYDIQLRAMADYKAVLEARMIMENISLDQTSIA